jgi:hypothetical protein
VRGLRYPAFRQVSWNSSGPYDDDNQPLNEVTVYPLQEDQRSATAADPRFTVFDPIPEQVLAIYNETIQARNFGPPVLAGAGLRAIVEALCIDQKVTGRNLQAPAPGGNGNVDNGGDGGAGSAGVVAGPGQDGHLGEINNNGARGGGGGGGGGGADIIVAPVTATFAQPISPPVTTL